MKIKNDYYAKVIEVTKSFESPSGHIMINIIIQYSPYYIEGLSDKERIAASQNEFSYLLRGPTKSLSHPDPIFRDRGIVNGSVEIAKRKAFEREKVNEQFWDNC